MIDQAIEEAESATGKEHDNLPIRRAADTAWLAASSVADIAAAKLGLDPPKGKNGRLSVLEDVEEAYRLRRGVLHAKLNSAHAVLHAACFYENSPDVSKRDVLAAMEEVKEMISLTLTALEQRPKVAAWRNRWRP